MCHRNPKYEPREAPVQAVGPQVELLTTHGKQLALVRGNKSPLIIISHGTRTQVSWVEVLGTSHHLTRHPKVNLLASYTTLLF